MRQRLLSTTMVRGALAAALMAAPGAALAQTQPATTPAEETRDDAGLQGPDVTATEDGRTSVQQTDTDEAGATADTADTEDLVEGVVVTGSRIVRPQYEGNIPGVQVTGEFIERRAFTNALDVLNDIPLVGTGTTLTTNGGQPSSLGVGFVDLLDLGTQRTLTLVNGRRFVSGNAASIFVSGNETGNQVDVNVIPVSLIERVDVLTVGGAAAYGSDAIAGVVNYVLKDNYEGIEVDAVLGVTEQGDGETLTLRGLIGENFLDDRANLALSYEYNFISGLQASDRDFRNRFPQAVANPFQGGVRNPGFDPRFRAVTGNTAFLPNTADFQPGTSYIPNGRNIQLSPGGTILNVLTAVSPTGPTQVGGQNAAGASTTAATFINPATNQLIPGAPLPVAQACPVVLTAAEGFCAFAPTALPTGVTAAQVFARYGVTPPAGATPAEQTALAVQVLQANRPTPREFFAQNPNIDQNLFFGSFVTGLPDVANTDPATNRFLPFRAVPIRFNDQGNVETYTAAVLTPELGGVTNAAPNSEGYNNRRYVTARVRQERHIFNVFGRFDVTENIELFTENLYADVTSVAEYNEANTNQSALTGIEALSIVTNVNNPYLDAADRAALAAAGITGSFQVSRTNQDIMGDNPFTGEFQTWRSVVGARGDLSLLGRDFDWESSVSVGKVEAQITQGALADIEYALAIDVARDPSGNIVCRSQLNPSAFIGKSLPGIFENLVSLPGADGVPQQQLLRPTVTAEQIAACQPLNPFGLNQMSEAAKAYVRTQNIYQNISEQLFWQSFVSGSLFDLPGGPLGFSAAYEYRVDQLDFSTNEMNRLGRTRNAPSAQTRGETRTQEGGLEFLIPIFGRDFRFPGLHTLDISPAVRWSKQDGEAPPYRNLQGVLVNQNSEGEWARIDSLAFTYKPIQDITFRGNQTKSIRQPNVTELFLGGQPAFNALTQDPCGPGLINAGNVPATRRANCIAAVVAAGVAPNAAAAETFLASFTPSGLQAQGGISGNPGLRPEEGESWTAGVVLEPRFIPRLRASVDYVEVEVQGTIFPIILNQAAQFCYDSPTFPDPTPQVGTNLCASFVRTNEPGNVFNIANGFALNYFNLGAIRVKGYNINADYSLDLDDVGARFGFDAVDLGDLRFRFNAFNLREYASSGSGQFNDTTFTQGGINANSGFTRPEWESQLTTTWIRGPLDVSLTWNYTGQQSHNSGAGTVTQENSAIIEVEPFSLWSGTVGYELGERYRVQLTVDNLFNLETIGGEGYLGGVQVTGYPDTAALGRRYRLSLRANF